MRCPERVGIREMKRIGLMATGRLDRSGWDDLLVIESTKSDKALVDTL